MIDKTDVNVTQVPMILALKRQTEPARLQCSSFLSLHLPLLHGASIKGMMALAVGSTIAGNLFILGAANTVAYKFIQNAEKENETLTFLDLCQGGYTPDNPEFAGVLDISFELKIVSGYSRHCWRHFHWRMWETSTPVPYPAS